MLHLIATSCFPNCHPAGQPTATGFALSGHAALGMAFVLLMVLFLMRNKGGSQ